MDSQVTSQFMLLPKGSIRVAKSKLVIVTCKFWKVLCNTLNNLVLDCSLFIVTLETLWQNTLLTLKSNLLIPRKCGLYDVLLQILVASCEMLLCTLYHLCHHTIRSQ